MDCIEVGQEYWAHLSMMLDYRYVFSYKTSVFIYKDTREWEKSYLKISLHEVDTIKIAVKAAETPSPIPFCGHYSTQLISRFYKQFRSLVLYKISKWRDLESGRMIRYRTRGWTCRSPFKPVILIDRPRPRTDVLPLGIIFFCQQTFADFNDRPRFRCSFTYKFRISRLM